MTQIWVIVDKSGDFQIRYDNPALDDKATLRGKNVFELAREPLIHLGEAVCFETGEIIFKKSTIDSALISDIKAAAAERISAVAPIWRQLNDLANPNEPGASDRRSEIDDIRQWSNQMEASVASAKSASDISDIRSALQNF